MKPDIGENAGLPEMLFEIGGLRLACLTSDLRFIRVSPAYADLLGCYPEDMAGKNHTDLCSDPILNDSLSRAAESGELIHLQAHPMDRVGLTPRKGTFCDIKVQPTPDETGSVGILFITLTDVTERILEHRRILQEKESWQRTFDAVPELIALLDLEHRILRVNKRLAEHLGKTPEECIGQKCYSLFTGAPAPPDDCPHTTVLETHQECTRQATQNCMGACFDVAVSPQFDDLGKLASTVYVARDITYRKEAEEELLRIRAALDDCGASVLIVDHKGNATYLNAAFGLLFGYTSDDSMRVHLQSVFAHLDEAEQIQKAVLEGAEWQGEVPMVDHTGRTFPALVRGTPVLDDEYDITGGLFIINDITERKQLEAQILQSQNMKSIGQLAAGIAHEINTPTQYVGDNTRFLEDGFNDLNSLISHYAEFVEKARQGALADDDINALDEAVKEADLEYLNEEIPLAIRQSLEGVERVTGIVRAMRQLSHPGTADRRPLNINDALNNTVTVARNEWRYVAEVVTDFDPDLPPVPCFPGEFNQVTLNLIVNAAHAIADRVGDTGDKKGTITISTKQTGDTAEIRIADTGLGIPEDVREHVFEPFFTTKEVGKGTGQGLAISYNVVVEKHHGQLTFETQEGVGTTFIIRLPLEVETDALQPGGAAP